MGAAAAGDSGEPAGAPTRPRVGPTPFPLLCPPHLVPGWISSGGLGSAGVRCALLPSTRTRGHAWRSGALRGDPGGGKSSRKNPTSQPGRRGGRLAGRVCGLTHLQNFLPSPGSVFATLRLSFRRLFLPLFLSPSLCPLVLCPSISPALAARPSVQPLPPRLFVSPQDSAPLCPYPPWSL